MSDTEIQSYSTWSTKNWQKDRSKLRICVIIGAVNDSVTYRIKGATKYYTTTRKQFLKKWEPV